MQRLFPFLILCAALLLFQVPGAAMAADTIKIAFVGDFLPAGSADPVISRQGYQRLFDGVRPLLEDVDAVVMNLETPLSTHGSAVDGKAYTFRAAPRTAAAMADEKVRAVWLANNHIMDFGPQALTDTIEHLDRAGISWAGAGRDGGEAYSPAVFKVGDRSVALLGYSNTFPESYWARRGQPGTAFGSPGAVKKWVGRTSDAVEGPLVVSFHWGSELMTEPKDYQFDLAHLAVDSGASLVVGHHPHVPQPIRIYKGVLVFYSLGNFAFGSYSRRSQVGLMAVAAFGTDGRCSRVEVYPLNVDNYEVNFSPRPITGLAGQRIFDPLVKGIATDEGTALWDGDKGVITPLFRDKE